MHQEFSKTSDPYEELRLRGRDFAARCLYDEALTAFEQCYVLAEKACDEQRRDRAALNRAAVKVVLGESASELAAMRRILMGSSDSVNRHLAAYNVSMHYESVKDREKGLRYARLALDHAEAGEVEEFISRSHNRIANTLIAESYFEQAREHYLEALAREREETREHAFILGNLGYCDIVTGRTSVGFRELYAGLRMLRRAGALAWESWIRIDLCYAHLEVGRYEDARRHGVKALISAEEHEQHEQLKNCLYLLGEVAKVSGESLAAYSYFARLRDEYYPEKAFIADLLMTVDARNLVNLKA